MVGVPVFPVKTYYTNYINSIRGKKVSILSIIISIALVVTAGALVGGVISMSRGGEYDSKHSTQLMFLRVGAQGVVILLLLLALYIANH